MVAAPTDYMLLSSFGIFALAIALRLQRWAREGVKLCKMKKTVVVFSASSVLPKANFPSLGVLFVFIFHIWTALEESFHVLVKLTLCASVHVPVFMCPQFPVGSNKFLTQSIAYPLQSCLWLSL